MMTVIGNTWRIISQSFGICGEPMYQVVRDGADGNIEFGLDEWVFSLDRASYACAKLNSGAAVPA